jgi:hypothetical protein
MWDQTSSDKMEEAYQAHLARRLQRESDRRVEEMTELFRKLKPTVEEARLAWRASCNDE